MQQELEMDWFEYRGLRIRYAVRPGAKDTTPIIMFNGIGQSVEILKPVMDALEDIPIITLDVPGTGLSDTPLIPWRYRKYANLAEKILTHLGYDKVNVMGFSWGGALAQQFAHQFPKITNKLILVATPPGHLMVPGKLSVYWRMLNAKRFVDKSYMASIAGHVYGGIIRKDQTPLQAHVGRLKPPGTRGYLYQVAAFYGWTSLMWLCRLKAPTLILQGNDDPMVPNINAHMMAKLIPDSRLEIIDCGHLFMLTRLDEVSAFVKEFVKEETAEEDIPAETVSLAANL